MTDAKRRASVLPLEALNPYTLAWTIRVRASSKGALRSVKTSRGESKVFSVELTDEQARPRAAA
jgi:ssDNA-binding replication factor A large subunit